MYFLMDSILVQKPVVLGYQTSKKTVTGLSEQKI